VVPSAFLLEATRDPIVMLMLLAHAKVPAGLEVHVSDQAPRTRPDFQFAREPGVPVEALVTAFNARHGDYRAEMIDGV